MIDADPIMLDKNNKSQTMIDNNIIIQSCFEKRARNIMIFLLCKQSIFSQLRGTARTHAQAFVNQPI
jgi:hypothetical protein